MTEQLLFYDIEVFHKGLFLVTQDEAGNVRKYFRDEKGADRGFLNFKRAREDIKGYTLVGFNNYFYDDHILPLMYNGVDTESVKKMSDKLIGGEVKTLPTDVPNKTLDCMQQIDNSYPGLKKIEANMGRSVFESSIPFDKSDSFSDEEVAETFDYCAYDVASTEKVYELRKDNYFGAKSFLISMLPSNDKWLQEHAINWNTTTIGAKVLLGKSRLDKWAEPYFDRKNLIAWEHPLYQEVPKEVLDLWKADDGGNVVIHNFDNEIVFGFGGIHSTNTTKRDFEDVTNIDVTSLYPNLIIKLGVLGEHTDKFATMVRERVGHKKTNKPLAAAEKSLSTQFMACWTPSLARSTTTTPLTPFGSTGNVPCTSSPSRLANTPLLFSSTQMVWHTKPALRIRARLRRFTRLGQQSRASTLNAATSLRLFKKT